MVTCQRGVIDVLVTKVRWTVMVLDVYEFEEYTLPCHKRALDVYVCGTTYEI